MVDRVREIGERVEETGEREREWGSIDTRDGVRRRQGQNRYKPKYVGVYG